MSFWDNVKKIAQPYGDDEYDDYDDAEDLFESSRPSRRTPPVPAADSGETAVPAPEDRAAGSKVISSGSNKPGVVLFRPISFQDAVRAADELRERKAVIVNLENVDKNVARRVVDFLSGCSYALDGQVKKIAQGTYLFCPHSMDIAGDLEGTQPGSDAHY